MNESIFDSNYLIIHIQTHFIAHRIKQIEVKLDTDHKNAIKLEKTMNKLLHNQDGHSVSSVTTTPQTINFRQLQMVR